MKIKPDWELEQKILARVTLAIVAAQALVVVWLLALSLNEVSERSQAQQITIERLEDIADVNQLIILQNREILDAVLCYITIEAEDRDSLAQACFANLRE